MIRSAVDCQSEAAQAGLQGRLPRAPRRSVRQPVGEQPGRWRREHHTDSLCPVFSAPSQLFGSSLVAVRSAGKQDCRQGVLGEHRHRSVPETTIPTNCRIEVVHGGVDTASRSCAETERTLRRAEAHHGQGGHDREVRVRGQEFSCARGSLHVTEEIGRLGNEKLRRQPATRVRQALEAHSAEPSHRLLGRIEVSERRRQQGICRHVHVVVETQTR